jgi:hypothetical protein
MSIKNKNKDHLKEHGSAELVIPVISPVSDDPLRFWTGHSTENTLIDLYEFADGATKTSNPCGGGRWGGAYSGRPELIAEVSCAIQARLMFKTEETCSQYLKALRKFWRMCDQLESAIGPDGRTIDRLISVRDLTHLHEVEMNRVKFNETQFLCAKSIFDDTRRLLRLGVLAWTTPKRGNPDRQLIPDAHAKALKIAIKRDWESVRKTWARNDAIRQGLEPDTLNEYEKQDEKIVRVYNEENQRLRANWLYFHRIQQSSNSTLPSKKQLYGGRSSGYFDSRGLNVAKMPYVAFPTVEEAHIAFHSALMRSGWNPSTLIAGIDATQPDSVFQHPKDAKQRVLAVDDDASADGNAEVFEEYNMQGTKRRAGGRLQFCMGLKKDPDSPPNIVAAYLERTKQLRIQLHQDLMDARSRYQRLLLANGPDREIERQFKCLQTLEQGTRNVWLYVDARGTINWLDGSNWSAFNLNVSFKVNVAISYLEIVTKRINEQRKTCGEESIAVVTPSDFRDIYARWVYLQSGGSVLAVMLALGHARLQSTDYYLTNNVFTSEDDEVVRKFMTHLFDELAIGRLDLTILAQLVRHGPLDDEMLARLTEYRKLTRSRIKVACADVKNPPANVDPGHVEGNRCGTHCCLRLCANARFLPESLDGIAMRVEELMVICDHISLDAWIKGGFDKELEAGEYLLSDLFAPGDVDIARARWHNKILAGQHVVPSVGIVRG